MPSLKLLRLPDKLRLRLLTDGLGARGEGEVGSVSAFWLLRRRAKTGEHSKKSAPMFTSGDALAGRRIEGLSTYRLCIVGQFNSVVLAGKEASSFAHVLKRVSIGYVMFYCFATRCIEIACKAIPSTHHKSAVEKDWNHNPQGRFCYSLNKGDGTERDGGSEKSQGVKITTYDIVASSGQNLRAAVPEEAAA